MAYVKESPITFADLSKAVQRSAGLGQDTSALDALPFQSPGAYALNTEVANAQLAPGTVAPGFLNIPSWAWIALAAVGGVILLGGRK